MITKNIDRLRELHGFKWGDNSLESIYVNDEFGTELAFKRKMLHSSGNREFIELFEVSENNLTELEFYGLKVILNGKTKVTREERRLLESYELDFKICRHGDALWLTVFRSSIDNPFTNKFIQINDELFPFITWESGKAWSKAELMELEVVE